MSALLWGAWGDEWAFNEKVSFNGTTKYITVNAGVTSLDISSEVYSSWVRWVVREDNSRFPAAMDYSGFDAIPNGRTGVTFFTINGWKLIYDPSVVAVTGVLYSRDYATAYWSVSGNPIYPATVSALVSSAREIQIVRVPASAADIASEILNTPVNTTMASNSLGEFITKKLLTLAKYIGLK